VLFLELLEPPVSLDQVDHREGVGVYDLGTQTVHYGPEREAVAVEEKDPVDLVNTEGP
jgi:hypothetical protein